MSEKQKNLDINKEINNALTGAFAEIDKKFGKGSVRILGQSSTEKIDSIPTGSLLLDRALGVGGFPRGRVIEIFGAESSGKTTLALHAIAQAQMKGGVCAFVDVEHSLDPVYASKIGVKSEDLIVSQPDYGEQALEITEVLTRSGAVDMIVLDSVAALVPKSELEGDMGDPQMGVQARLMSQALRKLTPIVHKSNTVLIFINQVRQKINAMPFGPKETTTGGNALKFYASQRLEVKKMGALKKGEVAVGYKALVKVVKNKVASPFTFAEIEILFNKGISREKEILDIGMSCGLFKQSGAWFSFKGEKFAQGRDASVQKIAESPEVVSAILEAFKNSENEYFDKDLGKDILDLENNE